MKKNEKESPGPLRERVYKDLRGRILSGKIPPGTRLVETTIAGDMGVSRTPVREALHKLDLEDLVRPIPRVGYIVNDMTEYDIEDLFTARTAVEQVTARCALDRITPDDLDKIGRNLEKARRVMENGQTKKMIDLDAEFHELIGRASRSKRLFQISQMLREHMLRLRLTLLHVPEVAGKALQDHDRIYRALKSGDPAELDQAVLAHLVETKRLIVNYLKKAREEAL